MPTRGRILYFTLALLFAISLTYRVRETADRVGLLFYGAEHVRTPFDIGIFGVQVTGVQPEGEAAGIRKGDTLLAFADRPFRGGVDFYAPLREARPGDRVNVQVSSPDATVRNASIELRPYRVTPVGNREALGQFVANIMPVFSVLLGFWVAAVRIRDPLAWLLLAMMISFGELNSGLVRTWFGHDDIFQPIGAAYQQFSANAWGAAMMLFGIYFPERSNGDRRWPWAKWLLIGPLLFRATQNAMAVALAGKHMTLAMPVVGFLSGGNTMLFIHILAVGWFFSAIALKSYAATNRDARRRLFLLYAAGL